jgi:hypothetical protein
MNAHGDRLVRVTVPISLLQEMVTLGVALDNAVCTKGLPPGAIIAYAYVNGQGDVVLVAQHDSFNQMYQGDDVPDFVPVFSRER